MTLKALVTAELEVDVLKRMIPEIEFTIAGYAVDHEILESTELKKIISDYDILISEFETVNADVLEAAEKLKMIICCRGGVRSVVDVEAAQAKNIMVAHNAGRNANAVSEMVLGYIILLSRNILKANQLIRERKITSDTRDIPTEYKDSIWGFNNQSPYVALRGRSLKRMVLGIVGYGRVGHAVAEKARAFGMNIVVYDPIDEGIAASEDVRNVSFEELLKEADVVTLHCPLTKGNKQMMGYEQFLLMKKDAFFINTARGGLVDENALAQALLDGEIAAAAIDVTETEPLPDDSPLIDISNLLITPHIAGASEDVIHTGTEMVLRKLMNYLGMDLVM